MRSHTVQARVFRRDNRLFSYSRLNFPDILINVIYFSGWRSNKMLKNTVRSNKRSEIGRK